MKKKKIKIFCCNEVDLSKTNIACSENWVNRPIAETVSRLKNNPYTTKETWEAKIVFDTLTEKWYSYSDINKLINN